MENPIKIDDLGVPLFLETRIAEQWKKRARDLLGDEIRPSYMDELS